MYTKVYRWLPYTLRSTWNKPFQYQENYKVRNPLVPLVSDIATSTFLAFPATNASNFCLIRGNRSIWQLSFTRQSVVPLLLVASRNGHCGDGRNTTEVLQTTKGAATYLRNRCNIIWSVTFQNTKRSVRTRRESAKWLAMVFGALDGKDTLKLYTFRRNTGVTAWHFRSTTSLP